VNVLILCPGTDIGGGAIALKRGFDRHPNGATARAVRRRDSQYRYPADIQWSPRTWPVIRDLFARADVVHVYEDARIVGQFRDWQRKKIVVMHVGSRFRKFAELYSGFAQKYGAYEAVASRELMAFAPPGLRGEVCPVPASFETITPYRAAYRPSGRVRIVQCPTNRDSKSTLPLVAACQRLAKRYPVDLDVVEGVTWDTALKRKAQADIVFDQVRYGYGGNAIEAWAMSIPVVAGYQASETRAAMLEEYGSLPFVEATEDTIEQALEPLVADASLREHWGEVGYFFGERVHSERVTVARMLAMYSRA
jgi:hypothetical protein